MNLITRADFSKLAGVSRPAINYAIKSGKIKLTGAGRKAKIDLDDAQNILYLKTENRERQSPGGDEDGSEGKAEGLDKPGIEKDINLDDYLNKDIDASDLSILSKQSAERLKVIAQIQQIKVKTEKERGDLVSREVVRRFMGKLYTIDVNELRPIGASLAPEIAAIADIEDNEKIIKIAEKIEGEIFTVLKHIKRLINEFLKNIAAEKLNSTKKKKERKKTK